MGLTSLTAFGQTRLHQKIDDVLARTQIGPAIPLASDAEFLRRVSLDLTGRIPSSESARNFLADSTPDKRQRLVDQLITSPEANRHLAKVFDIMLMERRGDKHVKSAEWDAYLLTSMQQNKPYNQLAREILAADGVDPKNRAPVKFYLDREDLAVNLVTRDTARVFFGRDIECAQCHDHPLISDYEQSEYYGLLAFLDRSSLFQPDKKKPAVIAEKAEGTVKFKSVFTGYEGETRPRLPGEAEISEPTFKKGEEYQVKPDKNVRPIPKYSRREKLAELATQGTNAAFNKNIANRLWAAMLGQGLVNPVDLHHPDNPPASAELLDLLTNEFVAMNFDIKPFLKEIALSQAYQRSFRLPDSLDAHVAAARQSLPGFQTRQSELQGQAEALSETIEKLEAQIKSHQDKAKPLKEQTQTAEKELVTMKAKLLEASTQLAERQKAMLAKQEVSKLLSEAAQKAKLSAQNLPNDQPLAAASQAMELQSQAWGKQVVELQQMVEKQSEAKTTIETQVATLQTSLAQKNLELAKVETQIQQIQADLQTQQQTRKATLNATEQVGREIAQRELLVQYADTAQQWQIAQTTYQQLQSELTAAQAAVVAQVDELNRQQANLATAQETQNEFVKQLADLKSSLDRTAQAAQLVVEALAQLETAKKHLPKDNELAAVLTEFSTVSDRQQENQTALEKSVEDMDAAVEKLTVEITVAQKAVMEAETALKKSQQEVMAATDRQKQAEVKFTQARGAFEESEKALAENWTKHFRMAGVEQLSPEQLAWSMLEAVGQVQQQRTAALAAWNKQHADLVGKKLTPMQAAEQAEFIEQTVHSKLAGLVAKFLPLFAANAGQPQHEFFATVEQALFLANGNDVLSWLRPSGGNLTDRLRQMADPKPLAEELYLSILTRFPSPQEIEDVAAYLSQRQTEKDQAIQEMAWALLTSAEFRFQH